jgi:hypothetical protein
MYDPFDATITNDQKKYYNTATYSISMHAVGLCCCSDTDRNIQHESAISQQDFFSRSCLACFILRKERV